ncbi:nodulation protein NfeD [Thermodesulfobacteriota bacterium]
MSLVILAFAGTAGSAWAKGQVDVITIAEPITPVIAEYIIKCINEAEETDAECLVVMLDTPGGLDLAMRDIIKKMLSSRVPVIVYVAPGGARAASAGALITIAAHVAAMAPGTNIGAAHPVNLGGGQMDKEMSAKVENDAAAYIESIAAKRGRNKEWAIKAVRESVSISETEALQIQVIDLVAADLTALLLAVDGRQVETDSGIKVLATEGVSITTKKMGIREQLLQALANPSIAYILMMLGLAGLYFELSNPGAIFPGVIGGISLILAFYSMQSLSANFAGVMLILLGAILFILELKIVSYGLLSIGGIFCIFFGSLLLFDSPEPYMRISLWLIAASVSLLTLFFIIILWLVVRTQQRKPTTGTEGMVDIIGKAATDIFQDGKVFVHGEYWNARSSEQIMKGEQVRVIKLEGMLVTVKKES